MLFGSLKLDDNSCCRPRPRDCNYTTCT